MRFQLWMQDEYGQQSTVSPITADLAEVFCFVTDRLNEANVNNALTLAEKKKNWEAFMPCFLSGDFDEKGHPRISDAIVYAGRAPGGVHSVVVRNESGVCDIKPMSEVVVPMYLYLGILDGGPWFAADEREEAICNINHRLTEGKSIYFVKFLT